MKSTSIAEVKQYVYKLMEAVDIGVPTGKLLNKTQKDRILLVQSEQKRVLEAVIQKITAIENRD